MAQNYYLLTAPTFQGAPPTRELFLVMENGPRPRVGELMRDAHGKTYAVNIILHDGENTEIYLVPAQFLVTDRPTPASTHHKLKLVTDAEN